MLFDQHVENECKYTAHDARHNYCTNWQKNVAPKHRSFSELRTKVEAFGLGGIHMWAIMIQDHRADDYHDGPYADAERHGMETPIELHLLHFFKVMQIMNNEDDDVDDEDHVHMNVDHAADHFAKDHTQVPVVHRVVVDSERDGEQEDGVNKDQVEKGDGGPGAQVWFQHANHKGHAETSHYEHQRVDNDQGDSVCHRHRWRAHVTCGTFDGNIWARGYIRACGYIHGS